MFGRRVQELHERIGLNQDEAAKLLGYKAPALAQWKARKKYAPSFKSVLLVSATFQVSIDWLMGDGHSMWRPQLMSVRKTLINHIIKDESLRSATPRDRLLAVWRYIHTALPDFQENIFRIYLGWNPDDWQSFLDGKLEPQEPQLERAEWVTGIPAKWYSGGGTHWIEPLQDDEYREGIDLLQRKGMTPEDVVRIAEQKRNPKD